MNSSNEKIREYFLGRVCPSDYQFVGETVKYICRLTCHKKLEKAAKLYDTYESLLAELKSLAANNCHQGPEKESSFPKVP